jgi:hypothetical protein
MHLTLVRLCAKSTQLWNYGQSSNPKLKDHGHDAPPTSSETCSNPKLGQPTPAPEWWPRAILIGKWTNAPSTTSSSCTRHQRQLPPPLSRRRRFIAAGKLCWTLGCWLFAVYSINLFPLPSIPLEAYEFRPLEHADSIRLLTLHPGETAAPIRISLPDVQISNDPSYEALSYTWA